MAGSSRRNASMLARVGVITTMVATSLVAVLSGAPPAGAAVSLDQSTAPACSAASYPVQRNSGTYHQTFTPTKNRMSVVQLCVNTTATGTGPVVVDLQTRDAGGATRTIATGANSPSTVADGIYLEVDVPDVVLTTGRVYELSVTLPPGVSWRGTNPGADVYPGGASLESDVGDYGFRQFANPIADVHTSRSTFAAAGSDLRLVEETFNTRPSGSPIADDVPGVHLSTNGSSLAVFSHPLPGSSNDLFATGIPAAPALQVYTATFDAPTQAVGFAIAGQDPAASSPATVTLAFESGPTLTVPLTDDDNDENTPFWFGYRVPGASPRVSSVTVTSPNGAIPSEQFEEIALDDLTFQRTIPKDIVFRRTVSGDKEIFAMAADGSNATRLTVRPGVDDDPTFSPDGSQVAFVSDRAGQFDIWVMDADGTDPRNLTATWNQFSADPSWSKQAGTNKVAFVSEDQCACYSSLDVYTVGTDGTGLVKVHDDDTTGYVRDGFPSWAPDDASIVFGRGSEAAVQHHVFRTTLGGALTQVTSAAGNQVTPAASGAGIAYAQESANGSSDAEIYILPAGGGAARRVTNNAMRDELPAWSADGERLAVVRSVAGGQQLVSIDVATGAERNLSGTALGDNAPDWNPAGDGATNASLTVDRSSVGAGLSSVALGSIPADRLPLIADGTQSAPVGSIPVGSIPVGSIPVGSIPVGSIDLAASPVGSIPVGSIFTQGAPVGSIPVGSIPVGSIGLGGTLVSSLGIPDATLAAVLAGTRLEGLQRQTLTLGQVLADPVAGPRFAALDLGTSGLGRTLFGSASLAALLLGPVALDRLPAPDPSGQHRSWCDLFAASGFSCAGAGVNPAQHSLLGAQLASAPVGSIPVGSIPVGSIPVGSIPVGSIPVGSIDLATSPVGSIPVGSIAIQGSPVGSIPVGSIPVGSIPVGSIPVGSIAIAGSPVGSIPVGSIAVQGSPVGSIPVGSIAIAGSPVGSIPVGSIPVGSIAQVLNCPVTGCDPAMTLAEAQTAGLVRDTAQLWMLGSQALTGVLFSAVVNGLDPSVTLAGLGPVALEAIKLWMLANRLTEEGVTLAQLGHGADGIRLGDIPQSAYGTITLYEILLSLLIQSDFPWEQLPVDGMQDFAPAAGTDLTYTARGRLTCAAIGSIDVDLHDFRYVAGSTTITVDGSAVPTVNPIRSADGLSWDVSSSCNRAPRNVVVTFKARPGLRLGAATSDLTLHAGLVRTPLAAQAPVTVTEQGEPDAGGRSGTKDSLIVGHVSSPDDVDTITIPMPAKGSHVRVFLSHIPTGQDYDLTVGMPAAAPLQSSPVGSIPVGSIPLEDGGRGLGGVPGGLPSETLQDIPVGSIPVGSISANRGAADEVAQVIADGGTTPIAIQVSGYNDSFSVDPYVVRVKVYPPIALTCAARTGLGFTGTPPALPAATDAAGRSSLFLVNVDRMRKLYPAGDVDGMLVALRRLAARTEVNGLVVPVEGDASVRSAYDAADADPCAIDKTNAVVRALTGVVARYRDASSSLRHVVLVGTDDAVPFARVADLTTLSNEADNRGDLAFLLSPSGQANSLYAASAFGYVLTDDAYTSFAKVPWLDHDLALPQIVAARLVETPDDVVGQVLAYEASNGQLDTATASTFTTGYDFLADGATAVAGGIEAALPTSADASRRGRLINETWTKADLTAVLLGGATPTVDSLNAHYSHNQLQPAGPASAAGGAGFTRDDLLSASEIPSPTTSADGAFSSKLLGRLLFTMGCHAGLNVPDTLAPTAPGALDWSQVYARQRAAVYVANTGYGYGDTVANALSERLMTLFADEFADPSTTLGEKLVKAKNRYFATMGTYGVFDEKALIEASFYGLPFWRIGPAGPAPAAPPAVTTTADATAGVPVASLTLTPLSSGEVTQHDVPGRGTYWSGPGNEVSFAPYRPYQPLLTRSVNAPGKTATGIFLKGLATTDTLVADFARALPTVDLSGHEPEPVANDDIYPANLAHLSTTKPFGVTDQRLVVIAGQSRGAATGNGGSERLVTSLSADVLYGTPGAAPSIDAVSIGFTPTGTGSAGNATFLVKAAGPTTIKRAAVLYKADDPDATAGVWQYLPLAYDAAVKVWKATAAVNNSRIEALAQIQDMAGRTGAATYKGAYYNAVLGDTTKPVVTVATPTSGAVYEFGQQVNASYGCADAGGIVACQGDVPTGQALDTTTVGNRTFTVEAIDRSGNRSHTVVNFSVRSNDTTPPTRTSVSPTPGGEILLNANVTVAFSCADEAGGTGVASCTATGPDGAPIANGSRLDTTKPGESSLTITGTDNAGNKATSVVTYRIAYAFEGFFSPLDSRPGVLNRMQAGATAPAKFRLKDANGAQITTTAAVSAISNVGIPCPTGGAVDVLEVSIPVLSSSLKYDGTQFHYNWKTDKAWANTCRRLTFRMADGKPWSVDFQFKQ